MGGQSKVTIVRRPGDSIIDGWRISRGTPSTVQSSFYFVAEGQQEQEGVDWDSCSIETTVT